MSERFDVIVVGAGAAGAALAARVSEDPTRRVLLLEAGPAERDPAADMLSNVTFTQTPSDWGLQAQATPGRLLDYPQGRALGGGSAVNSALAIRPLPDDLDSWAAAGNPGWAWNDVLPCLKRLEDDPLGPSPVHGAGGPIPVARYAPAEYTAQQQAFHDGCVAAGLASIADHNDGVSSGVGPFPMNRRDGLRVSTNLGYLRPAIGRRNLTILGDALVDRVVVRSGRAVGVDAIVARVPVRYEAGEVVVCAGAIQSPALLWRSGIGPADALADLGITVAIDLPGVGANLAEHPGAFLFVIPAEGACDLSEVQFQLGARTTAPASPHRNDLLLGMMSHWDLRGAPDFRRLVGVDVIFALTCGVFLPAARGSVTLRSAAADAAPVIDLNLCGDPDDVRRLVSGLRLLREIAESAPMRDRMTGFALLAPDAWDSDDALGAYAQSICAPWYHPAGTCRMGPASDGANVVDHLLRVHGLDGLRVADLSIAPTIPRATTNLTAIAIGERAAELIG